MGIVIFFLFFEFSKNVNMTSYTYECTYVEVVDAKIHTHMLRGNRQDFFLRKGSISLYH